MKCRSKGCWRLALPGKEYCYLCEAIASKQGDRLDLVAILRNRGGWLDAAVVARKPPKPTDNGSAE